MSADLVQGALDHIPMPAEGPAVEVVDEVPFVVGNTKDSGPGSLRAAIRGANQYPGPNRIIFAIPQTDPNCVDADSWKTGGDSDPDVFVISLHSALPRLIDAGTTIDGRTQAFLFGDTNPFGPEIVVEGSHAGKSHGLVLAGDDGRVYALNVHDFAGHGIRVLGDHNMVLGNYVGTDPTGSFAESNGRCGIELYNAQENLIGSPGGLRRNVVSGNVRQGIRILGPDSRDNRIKGNYVGVDATGSEAVSNGWNGMLVIAGSEEWIEGNVVSGNLRAGIKLARGTSFSVVKGNWIGTDADGVRAIGNGTAGVLVAGNRTVSNGIVANSIAYNGKLGIELNADGVTRNDHGDRDRGPNGLQNFPVLTVLPLSPSSDLVRVRVQLDSRPDAFYRIDVFASAGRDASGYGEGQRLVGTFSLPTDSAGYG